MDESLNLNSILNPLIQGPWNLKSFCHRLPVIYFHYTLSKLLRSHFFFNYNLWLTRYLYKLPNKSVYCVYMTKYGNLRTLKPLQEDSTTKHDKNVVNTTRPKALLVMLLADFTCPWFIKVQCSSESFILQKQPL